MSTNELILPSVNITTRGTRPPMWRVPLARPARRGAPGEAAGHEGGHPYGLLPHSFRATGATALLEAGVAVEVVQRLLNHADPRTTRFYDRRRLKVVQQDIEKMDFRC